MRTLLEVRDAGGNAGAGDEMLVFHPVSAPAVVKI